MKGKKALKKLAAKKPRAAIKTKAASLKKRKIFNAPKIHKAEPKIFTSPAGDKIISVNPDSPLFTKIIELTPSSHLEVFKQTGKKILLHSLPPKTSVMAVSFILLWGLITIGGNIIKPQMENWGRPLAIGPSVRTQILPQAQFAAGVNGAGKVLGISTQINLSQTSGQQANISSAGLLVQPLIDEQYLNSLIDKKINVLVASGQLKGQKGDKGDPGTNPLAYYQPDTSQNFAGGSVLGVTDFSSQNSSAENLTVANQTVNNLSVTGNTTLGTTTITGVLNAEHYLVDGHAFSGGGSQWTTADNEDDIFYNGGYVGIGTSTPVQPLTIEGNSQTSGHVALGNVAQVDNPTYAYGDADHAFGYNDSSNLLINEYQSGDFGATVPDYEGLTVLNSYSNTGSNDIEIYSINAEPVINSDSTGFIDTLVGAYVGPTNYGSGDVDQMEGTDSEAVNYGSGSVNSIHGIYSSAANIGDSPVQVMYGLQATAASYSSGAIDDTYGVYTQAAGNYANAVINNAFGVYVASPQNSGTVANNYGLYINDQSGIQTQGDNFNIYSAGNGLNYFGGNVGVNNEQPANNLVVTSSNPGHDFPVAVFQSANCGGACSQPDPSTPLAIQNVNENGPFVGLGFYDAHASTTVEAESASGTSAGIYTHFSDINNHYGDLELFTRQSDGFLPRLTVTDSGKVAIGTSTDPAYNLDVTGDINYTGNLYHNGSIVSGGGSQWTSSGDDIYFDSGNVQLGPQPQFPYFNPAPLNINNGNFGGLATQLNLTNDQGGFGAGTAIDFYTYTSEASSTNPEGRLAVIDDGNYSAGFQFFTKDPGASANTLTSRMTITSGGNVGIGTDTPASALSVNGDINFTGSLLQNGVAVSLNGGGAGGGFGGHSLTDSRLTASFDVSSQGNFASHASFSLDGMHMYVMAGTGFGGGTLFQYDLSSPWQVSSASYSGSSLDPSSQLTDGAFDSTWSSDGTKVYIVGDIGSNTFTFQYDLGIAWDISTASYSGNFINFSSDIANGEDFNWNSDGTKAYVTDPEDGLIMEYTFSQAWDLSTASFAGPALSSFSGSGEPISMQFLNNGSYIVVFMFAPPSGIGVYGYNLATPYDVSSAAPDGTFFDLSDYFAEAIPSYDPDGTKFYLPVTGDGLINSGNASIIQFALGSSSGSASQWTNSGSDIYYNLGNIGIGTAQPLAPLQISSADEIGGRDYSMLIQPADEDTASRIAFNGNDGGDQSLASMVGESNNGAGDFAVYTSSNADFSGGNADWNSRFIVTNNGNVGIATDTPGSTLSVGGDINFTGNLLQNGQLVSFSVASSSWVSSGSDINFTGGSVGIGTITPAVALDVNGDVNGNSFFIQPSIVGSERAGLVADGGDRNTIEVGINKDQFGGRNTSDAGSIMRFDARAGHPLFSVIYDAAGEHGGGGDENFPLQMTTGGNLLVGNGWSGDNNTGTGNGQVLQVAGGSYFGGNVGIGEDNPTKSLVLNQKSTTDGFQFTGTSISNINDGSGFLMALGYNGSANKQMWLGDVDYAGSSGGFFNRYGVYNGFTYQDVISGDGLAYGTLTMGTSGGSKVVVDGDAGVDDSPDSNLWVNGNVAIGSDYKSNDGGGSGLIVEGSVGIGTSSPGHLLTLSGGAYSDGSTWQTVSDFNKKTNFATVTPADILQKIADLPITQWNYKADNASTTHIGPTAQDFYAAFGLGGQAGETSIDSLDPANIALLGVQALNQKITSLQGAFTGNASSSGLLVYNPASFSGDSVGQAEILAGDSSVRVNFSRAYEYQPIVTATPIDFDGKWKLKNIDASGFTLQLTDTQIGDTVFNWHSFASPQAQLTVSSGTTTPVILVVSATDGRQSDSSTNPGQPQITQPQDSQSAGWVPTSTPEVLGTSTPDDIPASPDASNADSSSTLQSAPQQITQPDLPTNPQANNIQPTDDPGPPDQSGQ